MGRKIHGTVDLCGAMGRWRGVVREQIERILADREAAVFTRQGLLEESLDRFRSEFPDAKTPDQTMSRVLQELRDRGEIEFVEPGVYRLLVGPEEDLTARDAAWESPDKRPGAIAVREGHVKTRKYQDWFRSWVLPNFGHACAICKITPEWFLDAAHLRPVSEYPDLAGDASAGIALCKNHHKAMDVSAIIVRSDLTVSVDRAKLEPSSPEAVRQVVAYEGATVEPKRFALAEEALPSGRR